MPTALVAVAALIAGYLLGRTRPWDRLTNWVTWRMTVYGSWTKSKFQVYLTFWVHALVHPARTLHAWRHRHDPPVSRSAALTFPTVDSTEDTTP